MKDETTKTAAWGRNARPSPAGYIVHDEGLSGNTYIRGPGGMIECIRGIPMNDAQYVDIPSVRDDLDDATDDDPPH